MMAFGLFVSHTKGMAAGIEPQRWPQLFGQIGGMIKVLTCDRRRWVLDITGCSMYTVPNQISLHERPQENRLMRPDPQRTTEKRKTR